MGKVRFDEIARESRETFKGSLTDMPIVGLEHIEPYDMKLKNCEVNVETTFTKRFHEGQILFGRRRAYQHKACVATFDGICSGDITVIEPIEGKVYPDLLPYIIQNDDFFEHAIMGSNGALSPRVKWEHMANFELNLPSLAEQKKLAEKLWAAYEVKQSYLKMIEATEEMVKSQFIEMFYVSKFPVQKLKEHIEVLRGVSYKPTDVRDTISSTTSVILRSNNIDNGRINYDDLVYVNSDRVSDNQLVSAGDIVMCGSNGSKKLVGKAALVNSNPEHRTSFGAFCLGIRCKSSILPKYLSTYFQTSIYREVIEFLGSGSNILNIKPDHINNLEIPIPDIESQLLFVNIVDQVDKSISELRKSVDAIDKVIKSLINENL